MLGGDPGEKDGEDIFRAAEGDVGEWLGTGCDGCPDCGFGAVGDECNGCTDDGGEDLHLRRELRAGMIGQESGEWDSDESVDGIPNEVEARDFVGHELNGEQGSAGDEDPEMSERLQAWWKACEMKSSENSQGKYGGVNVQSASETGGDDERCDAGGVEHYFRGILHGL